MRFALLGDHSDGIELARAAAATGRHEILLYLGTAAGLAQLQRHGMAPERFTDLETVLADSRLDAVIVAGAPIERAVQLRRALQAEAHVLCVHPCDESPDVAVEAAMIGADVHRVLLPILPMSLHPGMGRFAVLLHAEKSPRMLEVEVWSSEEVLLDAGRKFCLPGWDVLRFLGGEVGELFVHASGAELRPGATLAVSGKFTSGLVLQANFLPNQTQARLRLALVTSAGRATLLFADGFPGPAQLTWSEAGQERTEAWDSLDPYLPMVEHFEQAVQSLALRKPTPGQPADESLTSNPPLLGWMDEIRALELDDAARRSAHYGRSSTLDLQDATEEATFKGTMTLLGCSLIWAALAVLIAAAWFPPLAWLILPMLAVFLGLQALRWIIPGKS